MVWFALTKRSLSPFYLFPSTLLNCRTLLSNSFKSMEEDKDSIAPKFSNNHFLGVKLPPLIPTTSNHSEKFSIELVDHQIWPQSLIGMDAMKESSLSLIENEVPNSSSSLVEEESPDLDDIEDLRVRKRLFYKLDRGSREFEEYSFDFHRRKSSKRNQKTKEPKKSEKQKGQSSVSPKREEKVKKREKLNTEIDWELETESKKRVRTPTFNQLTDPYHLPFCLDIYITKGSVRACIVHRVTSRVVAVAHSISKDLKFDLGSRKDVKACVAVGGVLAQRAIEDDIHNAVYTPRKGDKIEGKLQIVLQSIIDNGIDVKVKLKQKRSVKKTQI